MKIALTLTDDTVDRINGMLAGTMAHKSKDSDKIWSTCVSFSDGYAIDIDLVSCGRTGEDGAEPPYLDVTLFDDQGHEIAFLDSGREKLEGTYEFKIDRAVYTIVLEKE
jgi:hypothetical protein